MEISNFANEQFVDATLLNSFAALISSSVAQVGVALHTPGISGSTASTFSVAGLNLTVNLPLPFYVLFGTGTIAAAHGATSGIDTSTYVVPCASLVPSSGSVTVYINAAQGSIGLLPLEVVGPPQGHPDYDPSFAPFTLYSEIAATLILSATTTPPDNVTTFELYRFTLSSGQVAITGVSQAFRVRAGAKLSQNGEVISADLATTGVSAGTYTSPDLTIGVDGRITSAVAGTAWVAPIATEATTRASADTTLQNNINLKAPLASPALTGTPTAPTATAGTSTTQLATTAFVTTTFAPLASPALTGNPTAPTPPSTDADTSIATTAFVVSKIAQATTGVSSVIGNTGAVTLAQLVTGGLAPLDSPVLTGNPTAPTPAAGDNDTSIATTAFVVTKVGSVVAGVSSVVGFTGAVTLAQLVAGGVAPLASPALTGNPTAPTPAAGDNDTSIATTAFVAAGYAGLPASNTFTNLNTFTQTLTGSAGFISAAYDAGGASFRATNGNYGAIIRNDGANVYFLQTASGSPNGTYNAFRPFSWSLSTGAVQIDSTGLGVSFGGGAAFLKGLTVTDASDSFNLTLVGSSGWKKYIRVLTNNFSIVNNAYTAEILSLTDAGTMTIPGLLNCAAAQTAGNAVTLGQFTMSATAGNGGYAKMPNGFIIQWGNSNTVGLGAAVPFPITFPTACLGVVVSEGHAVGGWNSGIVTLHGASGLTPSAYTGYTMVWNGSGWVGSSGVDQNFIAVGY